MFTGILHTHTLVVALFLLLYLIKTAILYLGKPETLQKFTARTRVAEMIISTLFLLTGLYLAFNSGDIGAWFWYKMAAVVISIPVAIVAFRRQNKALAAMSLMLLIYAYGISETKSPFFQKQQPAVLESVPADQLGKAIYEQKCINCHGTDGRLGLSGSRDLTASTLSREEQKEIVRNGKNAMKGFDKVLSEEQIDAVINYIETL